MISLKNLAGAFRRTPPKPAAPCTGTSGLYRTASAFAMSWAQSSTANDVGKKLTCMEAETLAGLLRELGYHEAAEVWLECHALADDEPDDMHYTGPPMQDEPAA